MSLKQKLENFEGTDKELGAWVRRYLKNPRLADYIPLTYGKIVSFHGESREPHLDSPLMEGDKLECIIEDKKYRGWVYLREKRGHFTDMNAQIPYLYRTAYLKVGQVQIKLKKNILAKRIS